MLHERFLGMPLLIWGILAFALAVLFAYLVPAAAAEATGLRRVILRWAHALAWLCLAFFCFARAGGIPGPINLLALLAALLYGAFLVALLTRG